jgi:hypothetical protein
MNLINHTPFAAECTTAHSKEGRECVVVVVKATYSLPLAGEVPKIADQQVPIIYGDTATGEPGLSAPVYECDLCLDKPMVDVLLLGSAHAPQGKPDGKVLVGLSVGDWKKAFVVTGKRHWRTHLLSVGLTEPEPFIQQSISYDLAFGGTVPDENSEKGPAVFDANPIGRGFDPQARWADGTPGPQTEELNKPIKNTHSPYTPMGFGPLGRHWQPRASFAGTYDDRWQAERFPFLPADFDARYFQAAPTDQQVPQITGDEAVRLMHLTPASLTPTGLLDFALPNLSLPVVLRGKKAGTEEIKARVDTLLFEPDLQRFSVTWRVVRDLANDPYRYSSVEVGVRPKGLLVRIPLEVLAGELPSRQHNNKPGGWV